MEFFHAFWLAFIQGVTEFLPISSSGHLALVPSLFGWPDQGLAFDVAVHVGTLVAVLIYFRNDICLMLKDWVLSITTRKSTVYSKLAWSIAFATVCAMSTSSTCFSALKSTMFHTPVLKLKYAA